MSAKHWSHLMDVADARVEQDGATSGGFDEEVRLFVEECQLSTLEAVVQI